MGHTKNVPFASFPVFIEGNIRVIGSIGRECIDHVIIANEARLRRVLSAYANYYNNCRTHRSLGKDAPIHRPIERNGTIIARPILGGLHHRYARIE
jgi:hypothetical protein